MTAQTASLWASEREKLFLHFRDRLRTAHHLDRKTVSFQANKSQPVYRWFKYKEGFSSSLVEHFLTEYAPHSGRLLDPFAGSGTTLFAGQELGWETHGIELLPVGAFAVKARSAIARTNATALEQAFRQWRRFDGPITRRFTHLNITRRAFPDETEAALNAYLSYCETLTSEDMKIALLFTAFSILEQISFTRKDGQYLRWDSRSNRNLSGSPFDKGYIPDFNSAITAKFEEILKDAAPRNNLLLFDLNPPPPEPTRDLQLVVGSCLEVLPLVEPDRFDFVITSPPYCNRYDYTRTYALELAFLGLGDEEVRQLRQQMLSCTVENKDKVEWMKQLYERIDRRSSFETVMAAYRSSEAMNEINVILEKLNAADKLNNKNIARMVRNYFLEMCFVIYELSRVTKSGGYCVMVNDNVRYGGEEIPADLILSEFAQRFGYDVESILVLPRGKGNSSQQMGEYGRSEIRKCVYVWRKK